ncbi:MAG TPA: hypothetical protein VKE70_33665, partial [Candidatus Solibacter sp.]|nr:hypothetical protein [Candidatus Solibacter sp.]
SNSVRFLQVMIGSWRRISNPSSELTRVRCNPDPRVSAFLCGPIVFPPLDTRGISQSETPPAFFENLKSTQPSHCNGRIRVSLSPSTKLLDFTVAIATIVRVSETNVT